MLCGVYLASALLTLEIHSVVTKNGTWTSHRMNFAHYEILGTTGCGHRHFGLKEQSISEKDPIFGPSGMSINKYCQSNDLD